MATFIPQPERVAAYFLGLSGLSVLSYRARSPARFHDCVHSGFPAVWYSPTITSDNMPSVVIRSATENTPSMPSTGVCPGRGDFALTLPGFADLPTMIG